MASMDTARLLSLERRQSARRLSVHRDAVAPGEDHEELQTTQLMPAARAPEVINDDMERWATSTRRGP